MNRIYLKVHQQWGFQTAVHHKHDSLIYSLGYLKMLTPTSIVLAKYCIILW